MKRILTMGFMTAIVAGLPAGFAWADNVTVSTQADLEQALKSGNVITIDGTIKLDKRLKLSGGSITLKGGVLDGDNTTSIFEFSNANVTIEGVTFLNAALTQQETEAVQGGAIKATNGTLVIKNATFKNNTVTSAAGNYYGGGALYMTGTNFDVSGTTFDGNSGWYGGAIISVNGKGTIDRCTFSGNTAAATNDLGGGALFMRWEASAGEKKISVTNSSFVNNEAQRYGGAIYLMNGGGTATVNTAEEHVFTVKGCTFDGNHTSTEGTSECSGGAIDFALERSMTVNVLASTFANNYSRNDGGAIDFRQKRANGALAKANIVNCTLSGNYITANGQGNGGGIRINKRAWNDDLSKGFELNLINSIIVGNTGKDGVASDFRIDGTKYGITNDGVSEDHYLYESINSMHNCVITSLNDYANLEQIENSNVTRDVKAADVLAELTAEGYFPLQAGSAATGVNGADALAAQYGVATDQLGNALSKNCIGAVQDIVYTQAYLQNLINNAADGSEVEFTGVIPFTAPITITKNITITGSGETSENVLDGGNATSMLQISSGKTVTLKNITLRNGYATANASAVYLENGTLNLTDCVVSGNNSDVSTNWRGGAIYANGKTTLNVENTLFEGNGGYCGGALSINNAVGKIANSVFANNKAANTADTGDRRGGAILVRWDNGEAKKLDITSCKFENNEAPGNGGAIFFNTGGGGAAATGCEFTIDKCYFAGNVSGNQGGAVFLNTERSVVAKILASTFADNSDKSKRTIHITGDAKADANNYLANTTIANCTVNGEGGCIFFDRNTIDDNESTFTLVNSFANKFDLTASKAAAITAVKNCVLPTFTNQSQLAEGVVDNCVTGGTAADYLGELQAEGWYPVKNGAAAGLGTAADGAATDQLGNANAGVVGAVQKVVVTVNKYGMATLSSPANLSFNDELYAYRADNSEADVVNVVKIEGDVPANTGMLIFPTEAISEATTYILDAVTSAPAVENNLFMPSTAETELNNGEFVLGYRESHGLGFYTTVAGYKPAPYTAYLNVTGSQAKKIVFGGGTTGISEVETSGNVADNEAWYTLSGVKVSAPAKGGIYIKGGKKYVINK